MSRAATEPSILCDYCGRPAVRVYGDTIYPHRPELHNRQFWQCKPCDAYVGCHPDGARPLGRLANKELRYWRLNAHTAFDPLWRKAGLDRSASYQWLAERLGVERDRCHIGEFDVEMCKRVVEVMKGVSL